MGACDRIAYGPFKLRRLMRLAHYCVGEVPSAPQFRRAWRRTGHYDNGHLETIRTQCLYQRDAISAGHIEIRDDACGWLDKCLGHKFLSI